MRLQTKFILSVAISLAVLIGLAAWCWQHEQRARLEAAAAEELHRAQLFVQSAGDQAYTPRFAELFVQAFPDCQFADEQGRRGIQIATDKLRQAQIPLDKNLALWVSLLAAATLVAVYVCAGRVVCIPVRRMGRAMEQIADDEAYGQKLDEAMGKDELAGPAQAFNRVLRIVRNSLSSMRHANESLEQRVADRTGELAHRNAELAAVTETALDGILVTNHEGRIVEFNPAAQRIFECSRQQALQRKFEDLISLPEQAEGIINTVLGKRIETPARRYDGRDFPAEVAINAIDSGGSPSKFVTYVRDITQRKQAELDTQTARDLAECANAHAQATSRAKSEFLANMSHEIRTPLNGVVGMIGLLRKTPLTSTQQRYASVARASADALLALINDILDFSKIEAGKLELANEAFHLKRLVDQTVEILLPPATQKGLKLTALVESNVPAVVRGDPDRLRQILLNLVNNAVKFTQTGSVTIHITSEPGQTERKAEAAMVHFSITDTGIGIAADRFERLFKSFSQVDASTTRKFGGTGLGLAICKQLSELMGGQIGLTSEVAKGSTFWFTVCLEKLPDGAIALPSPPPKPSPPCNVDRSARLLLAEDNAINQLVSTEVLLGAGFVCDVVPDGKAAVEAACSGLYALVLMDCQMPEMDGFAAATEIRRRESLDSSHRHIPIVALTANAIKGDRERCLQAGMDDYAAKPLEPQRLVEIVETYLSRPLASSLPAAEPAAQPEPAPQPEPAAPTDDAAPIDWDTLFTRCMKNVEFVEKILAKFESTADADLEAIRRSLADGDMPTMTRLAHSIKGAAGYLSAAALRKTAERLEALGRAGAPLQDAKAALDDLIRQVQRTRAYIPQVLAKATTLVSR